MVTYGHISFPIVGEERFRGRTLGATAQGDTRAALNLYSLGPGYAFVNVLVQMFGIVSPRYRSGEEAETLFQEIVPTARGRDHDGDNFLEGTGDDGRDRSNARTQGGFPHLGGDIPTRKVLLQTY
jgi:hypothetical protein